MSYQKVIRTGSSLAVTIPSDFVKSIGIKPKDKVKVRRLVEKRQISYFFSGACQLPLSGNFWKKRKD